MEELDLENLNTFLAVLSFVVGGMIGSFLNVCVYRLPAGLSVVSPRSRCPKCENPLAWYDNVPIVSWLVLGAKCRNCSEPISWQYPLVEALTATLFLFVYLKFGLTLATPIYMLLAASLVLVTFVDLTDWTIPDEVTFPGIPIGIVCAVVAMIYPESGLLFDDPLFAIAAAVAGGGALYLLDVISLVVFKKRGMGFGDVKLMAMLGAFFGLWGVLLTIVVASFAGSFIGIAMIVFSRKAEANGEDDEEGSGGHYLPFGPYICLGAIVYLFWGPQIVETYINYMNVPGVL